MFLHVTQGEIGVIFERNAAHWRWLASHGASPCVILYIRQVHEGRTRTTLTHVHTGNSIPHLEEQLRQILGLMPAGTANREAMGITHLMSFTETIRGGDMPSMMNRSTQNGTLEAINELAERLFGEETIVETRDSGGVVVNHETGVATLMTDEQAMKLNAGVLLETAMARDPRLMQGAAPFDIRTGYTIEEGGRL
jgi:hypothetical protein